MRSISKGTFTYSLHAAIVSGARLSVEGCRASLCMLHHAPLVARFSKPIVLRDRPPLATLDDARAYLATLTSAQITPALYYARVMLGHALRTGKARDVENARLELIRATSGHARWASNSEAAPPGG